MRLSTVLFGCMLMHDIHTTPILWRSADINTNTREIDTESHSTIIIPSQPFYQRRLQPFQKVTITRSIRNRRNDDMGDARKSLGREGERIEDRCNCTKEVAETEERQLNDMPERTKTAINVAIDVLLTIIQPYFGMPGAVAGKLIRPFLFYLATRMFSGGTDFFKNMVGDESPGGLRDEPYAAYPVYIPGYGSYILLSDVGPSELINTTSMMQDDETSESVNEKDKPEPDDKDSVSEEKEKMKTDARSKSNTRTKERNRHRNHDRDKHKHRYRKDKYSTSSEENYRDSQETDDDSGETFSDSRERDRDKDRRDRYKDKIHKHRDKDTRNKHKDSRESDKNERDKSKDSMETTEKDSSEKDSEETKDPENDKDSPDINVSSESMKIVNIQSKFNPLFLGQTHLIPIFKKPRVFESEKDLEEANWSSETDDSIRESIKQIVGTGERIKSLKKRIMLKILEKLHSAVLQF